MYRQNPQIKRYKNNQLQANLLLSRRVPLSLPWMKFVAIRRTLLWKGKTKYPQVRFFLNDNILWRFDSMIPSTKHSSGEKSFPARLLLLLAEAEQTHKQLIYPFEIFCLSAAYKNNPRISFE